MEDYKGRDGWGAGLQGQGCEQAAAGMVGAQDCRDTDANERRAGAGRRIAETRMRTSGGLELGTGSAGLSWVGRGSEWGGDTLRRTVSLTRTPPDCGAMHAPLHGHVQFPPQTTAKRPENERVNQLDGSNGATIVRSKAFVGWAGTGRSHASRLCRLLLNSRDARVSYLRFRGSVCSQYSLPTSRAVCSLRRIARPASYALPHVSLALSL